MYYKECNRTEDYASAMWGISSAGRAPALHAGGQEFESPILHHFKTRAERLFFNAFQAFLSSNFYPVSCPFFATKLNFVANLLHFVLERY